MKTGFKPDKDKEYDCYRDVLNVGGYYEVKVPVSNDDYYLIPSLVGWSNNPVCMKVPISDQSTRINNIINRWLSRSQSIDSILLDRKTLLRHSAFLSHQKGLDYIEIMTEYDVYPVKLAVISDGVVISTELNIENVVGFIYDKHYSIK